MSERVYDFLAPDGESVVGWIDRDEGLVDIVSLLADGTVAHLLMTDATAREVVTALELATHL